MSDIVVLLVVGLGVLAVAGYLISPKRKREVSFNRTCYVERFGGDNFVTYLNSEYLMVFPGGKRIMTVEVIQAWPER